MKFYTLDWQWMAPALAAALVLIGYGSVWLFRFARWFSFRRAMDVRNVGTVRIIWDRKAREIEIIQFIRRPWPFDKWTTARSIRSTLGQLLAPVPYKALHGYVNKRLHEDRRKGQDK